MIATAYIFLSSTITDQLSVMHSAACHQNTAPSGSRLPGRSQTLRLISAGHVAEIPESLIASLIAQINRQLCLTLHSHGLTLTLHWVTTAGGRARQGQEYLLKIMMMIL